MADDGVVSGPVPAGPARRALLIASAAALPVLLTACRGIQALGTPPPPPADVAALRSAIEREAALVASYEAVTASSGPTASASPGSTASPGTTASPGSTAGSAGPAASGRMAAALAAVLLDHRQHLTQLRSRLVEPAVLRSRAAAGASAAATGSAGAGGAILTIGQLEQAEQAASDRLIAELAGLPPALAQLFASIAASEATHIPYLRAARRHR